MSLAPWVTVDDLPAEGRPSLPGGDDEWAALASLSTSVLHALSGARWAQVRTDTIEIVARHGRRWRYLSASRDWWWDDSWGACQIGGEYAGAYLYDGELYNHGGCGNPWQVRLPRYPVRSVDEVRIGDTVRDPASYRLRDDRWLEDRNHSGWRGWPTCDPGLVVTYTAGTDPPAEARDAARRLMLEIAYARAGDPRCALPRNVTAITRQGTTTTFTPAVELINAGRTGLPDVDLWLGTVNPTNRRHRPSSWSPDTAVRTYPRPQE